MSKTELLSIFLIFSLSVFSYIWMAAPFCHRLWPKILTPPPSQTQPTANLSTNSIGSFFNIHTGSHRISHLHCHHPQLSHHYRSAGLLKQPLSRSLWFLLPPQQPVINTSGQKDPFNVNEIRSLFNSYPSHGSHLTSCRSQSPPCESQRPEWPALISFHPQSFFPSLFASKLQAL